jgi:hypothetical protein
LKAFPRHLERLLTHDQDILNNDGIHIDELKNFYILMPKIESICYAMNSLNIPNSIEHGDLFDENFLLNKHSLVINDWADSGLGHPFFSYGFFIQHLAKKYHPSIKCQLELKKTYLNPWKTFYSYSDLDYALNIITQLSPLRTLMSYSRIAYTNKNRSMSVYHGCLRDNLLAFIKNFNQLIKFS